VVCCMVGVVGEFYDCLDSVVVEYEVDCFVVLLV